MKNNFLSGNGGFYVARLGEITDYSHSTRVTEGSPSKVLQLLRQMSGKKRGFDAAGEPKLAIHSLSCASSAEKTKMIHLLLLPVSLF